MAATDPLWSGGSPCKALGLERWPHVIGPEAIFFRTLAEPGVLSLAVDFGSYMYICTLKSALLSFLPLSASQQIARMLAPLLNF
jgi:hypothetical protein